MKTAKQLPGTPGDWYAVIHGRLEIFTDYRQLENGIAAATRQDPGGIHYKPGIGTRADIQGRFSPGVIRQAAAGKRPLVATGRQRITTWHWTADRGIWPVIPGQEGRQGTDRLSWLQYIREQAITCTLALLETAKQAQAEAAGRKLLTHETLPDLENLKQPGRQLAQLANQYRTSAGRNLQLKTPTGRRTAGGIADLAQTGTDLAKLARIRLHRTAEADRDRLENSRICWTD